MPSRKKADSSVVIDAFYAAYVRRFNPPPIAEAWLADMQRQDYRTRPRSVPEEKVTRPPIAGKKDATLAKKMVESWGVDTVLRLIEKFFDLSRRGLPPVISTRHDIGALYMVAPRLMIMDTLESEGAMDRRAAENAAAARRASGS